MFEVFKFIATVFYLFLSASLLYKRMPRTWFRFSVSYLILCCIASYFFFERLPFNVPDRVLKNMPQFLLFCGVFAVIGIALYRQLTFLSDWQDY